MADVAKVEIRTTPKIPRKPIFRGFCRCKALGGRYQDRWPFLSETMRNAKVVPENSSTAENAFSTLAALGGLKRHADCHQSAVLPPSAAPSILTAGKVHRQYVHNSDGLAENLFGCGGQIVGIVGFDFCGAVLVRHEHVQNTVVNAFHPHPGAKSVKFARAYQGVQHGSNRKLLVRCGMHRGLLTRPIYAGRNDVDVIRFTRQVYLDLNLALPRHFGQ
jgi:hypothetical protein